MIHTCRPYLCQYRPANTMNTAEISNLMYINQRKEAHIDLLSLLK